jgi:hypothetical protein
MDVNPAKFGPFGQPRATPSFGRVASLIILATVLSDVAVAQNLTTTTTGGTAAPVAPTPPPSPTNSTTPVPPNATDPNVDTPPPPAAEPHESAGSLQWYHVTAGVLGLFLLVGGACYVTLMWQQNAIRDYKNEFEELVRKVGLMRSELADELNRERRDKGADGATTARGRDIPIIDEVRNVTELTATAAGGLAGGGGAGGTADAEGPGGVGGYAAPGVTVGRLHTLRLRTAQSDLAAQERASQALEAQLRRQTREAELEQRRRNAGADLLGQAVSEAVAVSRQITDLERSAQWRSLRSLEL